MHVARKGMLMGLAFAASYYLSNNNTLQEYFTRAGQYMHVVKAAFLFTVGYTTGFFISKLKS